MSDKEPIRIFKSDFLERFSHIHPAEVAVVWGLVEVYALYRAISGSGTVAQKAVFIPVAFILGIFIWTFAEYALHRWLFHYEPSSKVGEKIIFLFHGIHHAEPMQKTRLVMPFPVGIPLASIFFGIFYLVSVVLLSRAHWLAPSFAGFIAGYLWYDLGHYGFHHSRTKSRWFLFLRKHHMRHHGADHNYRYGVSSPLWDYIIGTMPEK